MDKNEICDCHFKIKALSDPFECCSNYHLDFEKTHVTFSTNMFEQIILLLMLLDDDDVGSIPNLFHQGRSYWMLDREPEQLWFKVMYCKSTNHG